MNYASKCGVESEVQKSKTPAKSVDAKPLIALVGAAIGAIWTLDAAIQT